MYAYKYIQVDIGRNDESDKRVSKVAAGSGSIGTNVCICVYIFICTSIYMYEYIHEFRFKCIFTCTCIPCIYMYIYLYMYIYMYYIHIHRVSFPGPHFGWDGLLLGGATCDRYDIFIIFSSFTHTYLTLSLHFLSICM
jgi:hypothetical protein